jgi:4-amino-4-deoxy-L-arabinose transferase-like glycosyltransferase
LLLLGLAVRFRQYLFAHSFWYDESFLLLTIRQHGLTELLGPQPYNLVIPPILLWITRILHEFGCDGELMMRLPAFAAGLAALLLLIPLARRLVGPVHAVWAFLFMVLSRHALDHGCEVRPYTIDLLVTELLLFATVLLVDPSCSDRSTRLPWTILFSLAGLGPWTSFPAIFVLGGVSLALAVHLWRQGTRREWLLWLGFNGVVGISGLLLWWFSARHMYYEGMMEHWGHKGWGGFPDWSNPLALSWWVLWRPGEVGNYGNREMGAVLAVLAVVGAFALARRSRALPVLLVVPFVLALSAALIGKYPLAHRTTMFLLPCIWLLAAAGIARIFKSGRTWAVSVAFASLLLLGSDITWLGIRLVQPDPHVDYRGAYQFVEARRQPGDQLWTQIGVVYQTYYGLDSPALMEGQFDEAVALAKHERLWVVVGDTSHELRQRLETSAGRVALRHHVSGLDVLLLEPGETLVKADKSCRH